MSRETRYLIWSLVLVTLALGGMLLMIPSGARMAFDQRRSALRTTPDGVAAFARTLEGQGRSVQYRFDSYEQRAPSGAVEVLLEPLELLSEGEIRELLDWVEGGGTLVYSPEFVSTLADSLRIQTSWFLRSDSSRITPHPWTETVAPSPTWMEMQVPEWGAEPSESDLDPLIFPDVRFSVSLSEEASPDRWTPLVTHFAGGDSLFAPDSPRADSVATPSLHVTLGWLERGEGGVLVLGEGMSLANGALDRSPEGLIAMRAILDRTDPNDRITFSEYHQGILSEGTLAAQYLASLFGTRAGRVLFLSLIHI